MILKRLFRRSAKPSRAVYEAIVAAARHPRAYADWGVPDTVAGRYDMICLHAFLVLDRLKGRAAEFRQDLVDEVFRDMDRSLREMGVGDLSVGKKVRKMAETFYGRAAAYDQAVAQGGEALRQAVARNVFAGGGDPQAIGELAGYMVAARQRLAGLPDEAIVSGRFSFVEETP